MQSRIAGFALIAALVAAPAFAQVVDASGFFFQYEGSLTVTDTNPMFGGWGLEIEQQETNLDLDPDYDWCILEMMVSDPFHSAPFHLWPGAEFMVNSRNTHEMGLSMGLLVVWKDTDGSEMGEWGTGELLLLSEIGMNEQDDGGHSAVSFWMDYSGVDDFPFELLGSATHTYGGSWFEQYGPGWILEGTGVASWFYKAIDWDMSGRLDSFGVKPISMNTGDMNLDGITNYGDVDEFFAMFFGKDHDETRFLLADMDLDGEITMDDAMLFLKKVEENER